MQKARALTLGLWLLAIPVKMFLGPIAAIFCGIVGIGFLVSSFIHQEETDPESTTSLNLLTVGRENLPQDTAKISSTLKCAEIKSAHLVLKPNVVQENDAGNFSLVAVIRNVPEISGVKTAEGIRAYLEFKKSGKEIYRGNGAWVNIPHNFTTLKSGEAAELVLAVLDESTGTVLAVTNARSSPLPRVTYRTVERALAARERQTISQCVLADDLLDITATLTDNRGRGCGRFSFRYEWANGDIKITARDSS